MRAISSLSAAVALTVYFGSIAQADPAPSPSPSATSTPAERAAASKDVALGQVIVTAERYPTRLHGTPREAYLISGGELDRLGAVTVADGLRFLPGVVINDYGTTGHLQTALLRGASSTETLVLINGRPANEPGVGLFDFSSLPVQAVDHVEVVEGASSTLYGSAAMGGVINIITRNPNGSGGSASATLGFEGSISTKMDLVAIGGSDGGVRVDYSSDHGRISFAYPPAFGTTGGSISNNDANAQDSFVSYANDALAPIQVQAHVGDDTSDDGEPGSALFGLSPLARQQRDFMRGDVSAERTFSKSSILLQVYSDGQRIHYYDGSAPFDTLVHLTTRGFAIRDSIKTDSNTFSLGYDSRGDRAQFDANFGGFPSSSPGSAATTGLDVNDVLQNRSLTLTFAARDELPQGFSHTVVPSVGAMFANPVNDAGVRVNYGRSFRIPALEETSPFYFGNPALEPEYAATFDVGIFRQSDALTYFGTRASNLIVSEPPAFFPMNVSLAMIRGFNLTAERRYGRGARVTLDYTDYVRADDVTDHNRLPFRPTSTGSVRFSYGWGPIGLGTTLDYVGRRYADDPNTVLLPPYATVGLYIRHDVGALGRTRVTVRLNNVTGERVESVPGYPVLGPSVSLSVSTSWL